jgi:dihydroflavonol-4-reductase
VQSGKCRIKSMADKILVTGASGFIGAHIMLELLNHGYRVRGSLRNLDHADHVRSVLAKHSDKTNDIEWVAANLTDAHCWHEAVKGCDGVMHVASPVALVEPPDPQQIIQPAKDGTLNVLSAAHEAGIKRVVLTSSVYAVSGNINAVNRIQTADDWTDVDNKGLSTYAASKTIAEKAAWEFVNTVGNIELVTINPAMVLGPTLEADYGNSLESLLKLLRGDVPLVPNMGFGIVDVRDVASLHRIAWEAPSAAGQRLLCSNGFVWFRDIAAQLREELPGYKNKIPRYPMPDFLVRVAGLFDKVIASIVPDLGKRIEYDCTPAKLLGWDPRPPQEAISAGAKSLIEHVVV